MKNKLIWWYCDYFVSPSLNIIGFLCFFDFVWTLGQDLGPDRTGYWGLGLDNFWDEAHFRQEMRDIPDDWQIFRHNWLIFLCHFSFLQNNHAYKNLSTDPTSLNFTNTIDSLSLSFFQNNLTSKNLSNESKVVKLWSLSKTKRTWADTKITRLP